MPLLLEALAQLAKEKPDEPIEFVAKYLLDHTPEKNWAIVWLILIELRGVTFFSSICFMN